MASKGKGKEKPKSPPPVEVEQPPEKEVVPGKLSKKGWLDLLSRNNGTEIASELVNEICEVAFSIVYSHYLEKQAFPHAINDAKGSLLQIIEWQFLSRDEGERDTQTDPSWIEDEEPISATIDSWARGVVPSASLTSLQSLVDSADPVRVQSSLPLATDTLNRPQPNESTVLEPLVDRPGTESSVGSKRRSAPKQNPSRSRPVARHPKARLVALQQPSTVREEEADGGGNNDEREATPSLHSHTPTSYTEDDPPFSHPLPYGMKPIQLTWQKEVSYDERGNIVDMVKLDPTKFPTHCVKPSVTLVKPPQQTSNHSASKKQFLKSKNKTPSSLHKSRNMQHDGRGGSISKRRGEAKGVIDNNIGAIGGRESLRFPEIPTLPALVDTINPVPGVTVMEAGRTVHGPKTHRSFIGPTSPRAHLHPVHSALRQADNTQTKVKTGRTLVDSDRRGQIEVDPVINSSDRKVYVHV